MIDDEEDFCHFVKLNLEKKGRFKVSTALKGADGLKLVEAVKPDIILLDIVMQDMDGGEVAYQLKNNTGTKDIPIIFITAILQPAEEEKLRGRHHFIAKPVSPGKLVEKIDHILKISV